MKECTASTQRETANNKKPCGHTSIATENEMPEGWSYITAEVRCILPSASMISGLVIPSTMQATDIVSCCLKRSPMKRLVEVADCFEG